MEDLRHPSADGLPSSTGDAASTSRVAEEEVRSSTPSSRLFESHLRSLEFDSAISPEIIVEMGVWTATSKEGLAHVGFGQSGIQPPALVLPVYTWADGKKPAYHRIRPDTPRLDKNGKARKYEQPKGISCRVYCLPTARILVEGLQGVPQRPKPALPYLFVTEGEKKAAALVSKGLAAVALPGVWNFKGLEALRGDWDLISLRGLAVCIAFDSDAATNEHVRKAEDRLAAMLGAAGARVFLCRLPEGPDGRKTGADDFFARGGTVDGLKELIEERRRPERSEKPRTTDALVELATSLAKLWHDSRKEPFATVPLPSSGYDNLWVRGPQLRQWLTGEWFRSRKEPAPREALDRAIDSLAAQAVYDADQRDTAVRVGHTEGVVWLDLCDPRRRVVRIDASGWQIVNDHQCPVRFLRSNGMRALPEPARNNSLEGLKKLLSVDTEGLAIIEAFLVGAFMPPPGAFPILAVSGEQGSGKSFGCKVIKQLLDPSELALRRAPRDEGDLGAALASSLLLAFDNLSKMPSWLSDALCSLTTGGGIARRKLYTDADEHVVVGRRPILLNGINDVVAAPDLAERGLFVVFLRPADEYRRTEAQLEEILKREHSRILGAILDRVSQALRERGNVAPGALPRLADCALWTYAGTPEVDRDRVWRILSENRRAKSLATIEDDPLASALMDLAAEERFEGTARVLLKRLNERESVTGRNDRPEGWPASADALGKRLQRLKSVLWEAGVDVRFSRGKERKWTIARKASHVSEASTEGPEEPEDPSEDDVT